jgi:hypothetical protein
VLIFSPRATRTKAAARLLGLALVGCLALGAVASEHHNHAFSLPVGPDPSCVRGGSSPRAPGACPACLAVHSPVSVSDADSGVPPPAASGSLSACPDEAAPRAIFLASPAPRSPPSPATREA